MSILVTPETRVLVQGITGSFGARHTQLSLAYGTQIVAGVTPGKGGQLFENKVPIFDTVAEAMRQTGATASAIFVPPAFAADAILEGVDAGLDLVVCITEGIPVNDMVKVKRAMEGKPTRLIGPNCPGIVTPGAGKDSHGGCRIGIAPGLHSQAGPHRRGLAQRHLDLRGRLAAHLPRRWPIHLRRHRRRPGQRHLAPGRDQTLQCRPGHARDHHDRRNRRIGGGRSSRVDQEQWRKPVAGFIAGATAPPGRRMGHAGAIVSGGKGTAAAKIAAFKEAGIGVAPTPPEMADTLLKMM